MNKKLSFVNLLTCFLLCVPLFAQAQPCGCTDCGVEIRDNRDTVRKSLYVNNLANSDLGVNNRLVSIDMHFEHRMLQDLLVILVSPNGSRVRLMGRQLQGTNEFRAFNTDYDISFVECNADANPPATFPDVWSNQNRFLSNETYTGSFYPNSGCLDDITGEGNGQWELLIHDFFEQDDGEIFSFSLNFENEATMDGGDNIYCAFNDCNMFARVNLQKDSICEDERLTISFDSVNNVSDFSWISSDGNIVSQAATGEVEIDEAGQYDLTIVDPTTACSETQTFTIAQHTLPAGLDVGSTDMINCISLAGTLNAPEGLGADYSYTWEDALGRTVGTNASFTTREAGEYTLQITNTQNGCAVQSFHTIDQDITVPSNLELDTVRLKNCTEPHLLSVKNLSDPTISAAKWRVVGNQARRDTFETTTNEVSVALVGRNGCESDFVEFNLQPDTVKPTFGVEVFGDQELGCDITEVEIRANINNPKSFQWLGPEDFSSNSIFTDVSFPGIYTAEVTGQNNCTNEQQLEVMSNPNIPSVAIDRLEKTSCEDIKITASIRGTTEGYTWSWLDNTGATISDDVSIETNQNGNYTFRITSPDCTIEKDTLISINTAEPTIVLPNSSSINCANQELGVRLDALSSTGTLGTAGLSYKWFDENDFLQGTSGILTVKTPGTYSLLVEDIQNKCTSTASIEISSSTDLPEFDLQNVAPIDTISCRTPEILANISGLNVNNAPITWLDGAGNTLSQSSTYRIMEAGNYSVKVVNPSTTCSFERKFVVNDIRDFPRIVFQNTPMAISCNVSEAEISAFRSNHQDDATFEWSGASILSGQDEKTILVDQPGFYTFTITNNFNGCQDIDSVEVESNLEVPEITAIKSGNIDCKDTEVRLSGSKQIIGASFRYKWNGPNDFESFSFNSTVKEPGTYALTVIDLESGCQRVSDVEVEAIENTIQDFNLTVNTPTCFGGQDGLIRIDSMRGGTAPFTFILDNTDTLKNIAFDSLTKGTYNLEVIDKGFCSFRQQVVVDQAPLFTLNLSGDEEVALGEEVSLTYTSNKEIKDLTWLAKDFQDSCTNCETKTWLPTQSQSVQLVARDFEGCEQVTFFSLIVDTEQDDLEVQNAIWPNSSNPMNNSWHIFPGPSVKEVKSVKIFDRWGTELFATTEFGMGNELEIWSDSDIKDRTLNPGIFLYQIEVEYIDGRTKFIAGDIYTF